MLKHTAVVSWAKGKKNEEHSLKEVKDLGWFGQAEL